MEAAAVPGAVQRSFSEQFLTCAVCMEHYREPRQLTCLHSFCTPCLDAIIQQNKLRGLFPCPLCMAKHAVPADGVSSLKTDFRLKNLLEYIAKEQSKHDNPPSDDEKPEDEEAIKAEVEENITTAITAAKLSNKRIKAHMQNVASRQNVLSSKYDALISAVTDREDEICKIVHNICQNYRDIIEHDRKQMDSVFEEELQSAKESKWFLCTCYKKFKEILSSDDAPSPLIMMQLQTTVDQIGSEEHQIPKWSPPNLETMPRSQEDKFTLHSLIGSLMINRRRQSGSLTAAVDTLSLNEEQGDSESYHTGEEEDQDSNSDAGSGQEDMYSMFCTQAQREETEEQDEDGEEDEEEEEEEEVTVMTENSQRGGLSRLRRKLKKNKKKVAVGCSLLNNLLIAAVTASPVFASDIEHRGRQSEDQNAD